MHVDRDTKIVVGNGGARVTIFNHDLPNPTVALDVLDPGGPVADESDPARGWRRMGCFPAGNIEDLVRALQKVMESVGKK